LRGLLEPGAEEAVPAFARSRTPGGEE